MINLTNEDNMKLMARYPNNYFELAIVDPPYGIGETGTGRNCYDKRRPHIKTIRKEKYTKKDWDNAAPKKAYFIELFRVSKNQIIWGANYFNEHLPSSMGWVFWDKKTEKQFLSDGELAFTSFARALKKYRIHKFDATRGGKDCIHPTQKPVKLYEWLLMNYAKEGDKILDTHLGSGSISIACHNLGFDLTGCELDKEYYEAACKRLKRHQAQLTIF